MSERRGVNTAELLEQLVARAEQDELLTGMNEDFDRLADGGPAASRLEAERAAWERTLLDGLHGLHDARTRRERGAPRRGLGSGS